MKTLNCKICFFLFLVSLISVSVIEAQEVEEAPIFGPVTVLRAEGKPIEVTYSFSKLPGFEDPFRLIVVNGDSGGYKRISSASFRLNGKVVLSSSNFNQKVGTITKTVELIENNILTVKLRSKPGSFLKVSVVGQKIEQPEQVLDLSSVTVGPGGGAGKLENFATVNLGEAPLRPSLTLKLEKIISPAKLELYSEASGYGAGPALSNELLRITSSENITDSIAVAIQIPPALVSNLPQGYQVEIFAEFTQLGDDGGGGVMPGFERLGASYDSIRGIAYANIPPYAFTPTNSVTTSIVIGSYEEAPTSQVTGDNIVPSQDVNAAPNVLIPLSADLTFSIPLPIENPLHTDLTSPGTNGDFGPRINPKTGQPEFHKGVDLNPSPDAENVPVYSILAGTVTAPGPGVGSGGSGIRIWIDHGNGLKSFYCHLSKYLVSAGTGVDTNKQIGISGQTGQATGDHLHLEYRINGNPVDPMLFINGNQDQYLNGLSVVALVNGNAIEATRQQVSGAQVAGNSAFFQYQSQLDLVPLALSVGSTNQLSIVVQHANGASSQITTVPLTINAFPLRVTLRWDKYDTDVDLHVMDSLGNESWYGNLCGIPNGCLDRDDVDGFGPEVFDLTKLAPGVSYTVFLHYYSDHGNGSTTATVVVEQGAQTFGPFSYTLSNNQFATVGVYPQ